MHKTFIENTSYFYLCKQSSSNWFEFSTVFWSGSFDFFPPFLTHFNFSLFSLSWLQVYNTLVTNISLFQGFSSSLDGIPILRLISSSYSLKREKWISFHQVSGFILNLFRALWKHISVLSFFLREHS